MMSNMLPHLQAAMMNQPGMAGGMPNAFYQQQLM
jgi:hypothetical protein